MRTGSLPGMSFALERAEWQDAYRRHGCRLSGPDRRAQTVSPRDRGPAPPAPGAPGGGAVREPEHSPGRIEGFGGHSTYPLLADARAQQADPGGQFLLADTPDGDIDVIKDGQPQYRLELRERALDDFVPTCWWQQTSPRSHFTKSVICSRLTEDGRISISGRRLIRTVEGQRLEENLPDDQALLAAYRNHFGINLHRMPAPAARDDVVS
jgi:arylamine N-acetyltransferase